MIYCNLKGGLGNMLFQIAATKSIAIDNNTDCSFPNLESHIHYLNSEKNYNPTLNHGGEYIKLFKNLNVSKPTTNKIITYPFTYIKSPSFNEDIIIDGFFQSEKYFSHNRVEILKFIQPTPEIISINDKYSSILKTKSTSIHVRRGDYLRHPNHHPVQTLEYYNDAINTLKDKTETFIVFSDDIKWCKNNLKFNNILYIENEKDYIELYLMSFCKNNIISNSSFSWWGAWLNENENKTVIGPNKWFGSAINHDTNDVIPEMWIKI